MRWQARWRLGYSHLRAWLPWWPTPSATGRRSQFLTRWTSPPSVFITWELAFPRGSGLREWDGHYSARSPHRHFSSIQLAIQVSPTQCGKSLCEGAIWKASYIDSSMFEEHFEERWNISLWTAFIKCFAVQAEIEQFWVLVLYIHFTDGK